jgi:O-antigen biosynthesis protein
MLSDLANRYWFLEPRTFGPAAQRQKIDSNTINWVIPDFHGFSGGYLTLSRLVINLQRNGWKNHIILGRPNRATSKEIQQSVRDNFMSLGCPVSIGPESMPPAYFTFATNWTTAYMVKNFTATALKCYLTLDYEPYFYPYGTDYHLAARSYEFGFETFAGGNWLANELLSKHNVSSHVFGFACDENFDLINPISDRHVNSASGRLLFYARPSTPRRGFELGMMAIEKVIRKLPKVQVLLAGCDLSGHSLPAQIKSVGVLPLQQLPQLYRSCDAALIISFTNISLLPLDLMANRCAVVSNRGPQVEWLLNEHVSMLADADVDALATALEQILSNQELRSKKIDAAAHYVSDRSWSTEANKIAAVLKERRSYCHIHSATNQ